MGIPDAPVLDLIERVGSWIPWTCDFPSTVSWETWMTSAGAGELETCIGGGDRRRDGHGEGPPECSPRSASLSPLRSSFSRSDEDDTEDTNKHFFSPSEYRQDSSDVESCSLNTTEDFYSFKSVASSPLDSPSRSNFSPQQEHEESPNRLPHAGVFRRPAKVIEELKSSNDCTGGLYITQNQTQNVIQPKPLDFENNGLIWFPPPPENEGDDVEDGCFEYDDEEGEIRDSSIIFSSSVFSTEAFPAKEKRNDAQKEPLKTSVLGHFRALVLQLLKNEGINCAGEDGGEGWLDTISSLVWQSANFVKPDNSRGGSMDPGDFVKVKCVLSGKPSDSTLVKGVVCTKNVNHKRMLSQHKNPRVLVLGGALEFQRMSNELASINTVLEQEIEHLKMAVAKVEAHRPNVLLVEKSVSSYAQKYLLEKEISFVLNVKRPLLERIAKCTGANISPSIDSIASARLGQCEIFRLEKVSENHPGDPLKKKKTLMFFEGCPRRLGCTVILRGTCLEELKKVKHVVQYASFAAYHLLLETSFLADEGATFLRTQLKTPYSASERATTLDSTTSTVPGSDICNPQPPKIDDTSRANGEHDGPEMTCSFPSQDALDMPDGREGINCELEIRESFSGCLSSVQLSSLHPSPACTQDSVSCNTVISDVENNAKHEVTENILQEEGISGYDRQPRVLYEKENTAVFDNNLIPGECFSNDNHQSVLVSLSSRCVLKGIVCQRAQLLRIKFYGSFDKPLGRYLRDDLFDQAWCCDSCQEPVEAHVKCYTHQHGSVTINVRRLPSLKLPGECKGRIWMWHRCLKCTHEDGVPPATRRVVMSNAARGLSFGKFLELSFSNHATANRIASCGHSLQRDCLRFYGFGSVVAFFRYSPTDILSVHLPPSLLKFNSHKEEEWVMKELTEISSKMNSLYAEIFDALHSLDQKSATAGYESSKATDFHDTIMELKDLLKNERNKYEGLLQPVAIKYWEPVQSTIDILELNRLRLSLLIDSHIWSHRLYLVDSSLKSKTLMSKLDLFFLDSAANKMQDLNGSFGDDGKLEYPSDEASALSLTLCGDSKNRSLLKELEEFDISSSECNASKPLRMASYTWSVEGYVNPENFDLDSTNLHKSEGLIENTSMVVLPSPASNLSDKIDSAWTGMAPLSKTEFVHENLMSGHETSSAGLLLNHMGHPHHKKIMSPIRVYSFDSAPKQQERDQRGFPSASLHLSSVKSFDFRGGLGTSSVNLISKMRRAYSETSSIEAQNLISSSSHILRDGARLLLPQGHKNLVITVHDNEPSSVICYALSSKEYVDFVTCRVNMHLRRKENQGNKEKHTGSPSISSVQESNGLLDLDGILYCYNGSGKVLSSKGTLIPELKETHFRVAFDDETSFHAARSEFSVTCYFAKQFDALRKKCCPNEIDFIRSLSRCRKWGAQGGKSNVYFAKSLDERFIIKQVTKTELESFEEFSSEYFKYVTETINSGSPTCLAKILGIYQVTVKHLKGGGREVKMDLMVMENLFYKRSISRIYDLKGSSRSRYNSDTTGNNKVMLDVNLLETLRTKPIFLGTKAKRRLERAVWNDTSFLASVDVMDYSLLVGLDEERKELIIGIIDFMRQYTWDKHLETWVKASGILGGPKNETPTIISPKQYKKRFRKAMSTYFLAVPDQWPS